MVGGFARSSEEFRSRLWGVGFTGLRLGGIDIRAQGLDFGVGCRVYCGLRVEASEFGVQGLQPLHNLVAEWIHFTHFGIILPTIKLKVHTFWGL